MIKRVLSGIILAVLAIVVFFLLGTVWRVLGAIALMLLANHEMLGAIRALGMKPRSWPTYLFIILLIPCALLDRSELYWSVMVIVVIALFIVSIFSKQMRVIDVFSSVLPIIYPLSFFQFVLTTVLMDDSIRFSIMLLGIGGACLTDTFALFGGLAFGKHKLAPQISPKKTWEGAFSGFIGALVSAVIIWIIQRFWNAEYPLALYLIGAAFVSVAGQIGDLAASSIKREAGIKDFSNLIPGHGGILDRLDSILFAMPMAVIIFAIYGILFP